jgi:hypothetical protein
MFHSWCVCVFCCICLFGTLCGCCSKGFNQTLLLVLRVRCRSPSCLLAAQHLLLGHFMRPVAMSIQCHLLISFRPTHDRLPSDCSHLHNVFLSIVFPVLLASFVVFYFIPIFAFFLFFPLFPYTIPPPPPFFACNKAQSSLFDLPIYILMLCGVFALGPNL